MKRRDRVELRASYSVIDRIVDNTLDHVDRSIYQSVEELYHIEDYLPRELALFLNSLMCLPRIEED
jgi:hypothetical protein